jgi:hypothetical protein
MFGSFNKADLGNFYHFVFVNVARIINVVDAEWKSIGELKQEINDNNSNIYSLLTSFLTAYQAWYDYSYDASGNLIDPSLLPNLSTIVNKRDSTRKQLIDELDKYR